jgi:mannose-6-phosphate isomerase-like protein (cupin superfamily)
VVFRGLQESLEEIIVKPWGFELILVNNELYCSKLICVFRERWSSGGRFHYHELKDETFIVLIGSLVLEIEGFLPNRLKSLNTYRIKPGIKHKFTAGSAFCLFLEVSTPDSEDDNIRC